MPGTASLLALPAPGLTPASTADECDGARRPVPAVARVARPAPAQPDEGREPAARPTGTAPQVRTQVLGQGAQAGPGLLAQHGDGPALGSLAYRRAGAEPVVYSQRPRIVRFLA